MQYRIDGITLPDGVSFFGQDLSTRFVDSMTLIAGAPCRRNTGLRTAGVVDIQSKSGTLQPGGAITLSGGSQAARSARASNTPARRKAGTTIS